MVRKQPRHIQSCSLTSDNQPIAAPPKIPVATYTCEGADPITANPSKRSQKETSVPLTTPSFEGIKRLDQPTTSNYARLEPASSCSTTVYDMTWRDACAENPPPRTHFCVRLVAYRTPACRTLYSGSPMVAEARTRSLQDRRLQVLLLAQLKCLQTTVVG